MSEMRQRLIKVWKIEIIDSSSRQAGRVVKILMGMRLRCSPRTVHIMQLSFLHVSFLYIYIYILGLNK